jgi:hypothetical protein
VRSHVEPVELKITNAFYQLLIIRKHVRCPARILRQAKGDSRSFDIKYYFPKKSISLNKKSTPKGALIFL